MMNPFFDFKNLDHPQHFFGKYFTHDVINLNETF